MNPNETNPSSPTGTSGAAGGATPTSATSSVPSPVDFTNPSSLNTNTSSLSMADSLASAQDNLTSAGQAADTGASTVMGLGEIGASSASATMDRPGEALTPADPVPGSIGSVTSVPPLAPEPMDMGALGGNQAANAAATGDSFGATTANNVFGTATNSADTTTASGADAMTSAGGAFGTTNATTTETATGNTFGATAAPATSSFGTSAGSTDANATAAAKPVQPYYNPFARTMGANTAATSSTNVPPALQPQTEKFSNRMNAGAEKKKPNIMMLLGWLLTALFAVTTVVFLILWMDAKNNPQIIYRDKPVVPDEPVADTVSLVNCAQDYAGPVVEGLENLTGERKEVALRFVNGKLEKADLSNIYTFTDDAAAEASRGYFDGQNAWYNDIATNAGVAAITSNLNIEGNTARQDLSATAENLTGEYINVFALTADGAWDTELSEDSIRQNYTQNGFACTAAE